MLSSACALMAGLLLMVCVAQGAPGMGLAHRTTVMANDGSRAHTPWSTVEWAGYSIALPGTFRRYSPTNCVADRGPFVIVGTYTALFGCMSMAKPTGVEVLLGYDGPPIPLDPDLFGGEVSVHGVEVQELIGAEAEPAVYAQSYLLALLPGMNVWAAMSVPGSDLAKALKEPLQILGTLRRTAGSPPAVARKVPLSSFVGNWHLHGAFLKITSTHNGQIWGRGGCTCLEFDTLALKPQDNQLEAVVTRVRAVGPTGRTVPEPYQNQVVGQRSFFEFVEPHLLLQVLVPNKPRDLSLSVGTPSYWCGTGLAARFENACGL